MKKPESLQFVLSASRILSVNSLYNAKIVGNGSKSFATIYKSGEAKKTEAYIKDQVKAIGELPGWINKDTKFDMIITVIFRSGLLRRDLDNTIKLIQDGIFRALDINDSHVMSIKAYKTLCPNIPEEKVCIQLSEAVGEPRFDKLTEELPRPHSVCIMGSVDSSSLKKDLEKKGVKIENSEDNSECEIYLITSDDLSVSLASKIIASSFESSIGRYGAVFVGILGESNSEVEEFMKTINQISSGSPRVKASLIESPSELLGWLKKPRK